MRNTNKHKGKDYARERAEEAMREKYSQAITTAVVDSAMRELYVDWLMDEHDNLRDLKVPAKDIESAVGGCIDFVVKQYSEGSTKTEGERRKCIEVEFRRIYRQAFEALNAPAVNLKELQKKERQDMQDVLRGMHDVGNRDRKGYAHLVGRGGKSPPKVVNRRALRD